MKKSKMIAVTIMALLLITTAISSTFLYLIDMKKETNTIIAGYNEVSVTEDFTPPSKLEQGENSYKKAVRIQNTGNTDAYVRVYVAFSSQEIEDISEVSSDNGITYSSFDNFPLNEGWTRGSDSYFYYTEVLAPGESTPYLFTNVKTTFNSADDIQQYEIIVYAESVQTRDKNGEIPEGFDYAAAWNEFLQRR